MTDDDLNAALAPTGALRVVINTGNAILTRPTADGQPAGISVDLARALAARRGLPLDESFDAIVLGRHGITLRGLDTDVMLAGYLLDANYAHPLEDLVAVLGVES